MILYRILRPQVRVDAMHSLNDQASDKALIIKTCKTIP